MHLPPDPEETKEGERRFFRIVLLVAATWVFALGLWNRDQGLPNYLHPDELNVVQPFVATFDPDQPDWNPHRFTYPTFFTYLNAGLGRVWNLAAPVFDAPTIDVDLEGRLTAVIFGRTLCAVLAALSVVLLGLAGRLWYGPTAGALAAAALAAAPLPVLQTHYVNVDTPLVFLLCAILWMAARVQRLGRERDFWILAVLIGLAAGTKYPGAYALIVPAALVAPRLSRRGEVSGSWRWAITRCLGAGAVAALVFLLTTPYAVFDFATFKSWFLYEADHAADRQLGWDLRGEGLIDRPYVYPLFAALPFAMGWPLWALGAAGLASAIRQARITEGILVALLIVWMIGTGWAETYFHRYALPLVPLWALLIGGMVSRAKSTRWRRALVGLVVVAAGYGMTMAASLTAQLRPQPRVQAVRWIEEHVPEGRLIAIASTGDEEINTVEDHHRWRFVAIEPDREWLEFQAPDVVLVSEWWSIAYRRYPEDHPEAIALLEALEDPAGAYEQVAAFEAHFWTEWAYTAVDLNFGPQFETPGVRIYRRR